MGIQPHRERWNWTLNEYFHAIRRENEMSRPTVVKMLLDECIEKFFPEEKA